ncbi:MAG: hypothetical protein A3I75_05905 [Deltaproteobacteria bacterium RIFCSPLOWO2_02_FULL_50_16]|nr:MAG: hypothetical protein A2053_02540 [Deltaproteobacteria bacterium GWA2_50_8]OGQ25926.1 MAG: hypothetical protein A3B79_00195 [Deltaproteobacteria bacterium RIFCSPHIGHO2_02_FULL_50_15]OGQ56709.1 MAG: hypothetical protein A3I75_05905 [Deltaproteobacteria bacterium RIFCSPLOWO2_02_FULL_50_16]OGQ67090.1 MAG: hypothetical protein A3F89_01400 [Deltaproteobacteria bacterium RIFCSPLOWO2_12_FULL_50_11]
MKTIISFFLLFSIVFFVSGGCKKSPSQKLPEGHPPLEAVDPHEALQGTIEIDPKIQGKLPKEFYVFLIAQGQEGPPVGVDRLSTTTFPLPFILSTSSHMGGKPDQKAPLYVTAKIDQDGKVGLQPGDLSGKTKKPVKLGDKDIKIIIDTVQ